jgi:hypothetical protein
MVEAFEPRAFRAQLHAVRRRVPRNLELARQPDDPEAAIRSFVRLIRTLPPRARKLWKRASKREFSIGVWAGSVASSFELALSPATLRLAAAVDARMSFVVYVGD